MNKLKTILIPILCASAVIIFLKTIFIIGYVPSESMEPTLKQDSIIIGIRHFGTLSDGDIIIFRHDGKLMVKRIAAAEGEKVMYRGLIQTVPCESYFVLGDNSDNSYDSRYWFYPYVKQEDVIAKVIIPLK